MLLLMRFSVTYRHRAALIVTLFVGVCGCGQPAHPPSLDHPGADRSAQDSNQGEHPTQAGDFVKPDAPATSPGPQEATARNALLEIAYLASDRPFVGSVFPPAPRTARLDGYVLQTAANVSPGRLYPAMGSPVPAPEQVKFWLGKRTIDLSSRPAYDQRELVAVGDAATVDTKHRSPEELRDGGARLAAERPNLDIRIEQQPTGFRVEVGGESITVAHGESAVLHESSSSDDGAESYYRVVAAAHGKIEVATFDAARQWELSGRLLREGPYQDALEAAERVLLAAPQHEQALKRWAKIRALLESGATPSMLEVRLAFPGGVDSQPLIETWKTDPAGVVALAPPEAPPGEIQYAATIYSSTVRLPVPSGEYRVSLYLSGFQRFDQEIEIHGTTKLEIPLAAEP